MATSDDSGFLGPEVEADESTDAVGGRDASDEGSPADRSSNLEPLDPERVSAALAGGAPIERFSRDWLDEGDDDEEEDLYLGTTLADRYVVEAIIGEGAMGRVYLAHHEMIGKQCAIKILHAELARDKEAVGRFVREARSATSIGNPHIIDISDFGEVDGCTFFVMEYLDGPTLADLIEMYGVLAPELVMHLGAQLASGLAAAHEQGIIHRDLKPDNVMIVAQGDNEHFVKILDFGIAKVSSGGHQTKLTMAGAVFGTPHYMAPEQAAGTTVDHRADIYALGVLLYEMASGELPFTADNFMGILTQHMYRAPAPIRTLTKGAKCPEGLEAIILKCLAKKPSTRYASMSELVADLRRMQEGLEPLALSEPSTLSARLSVPAEFLTATDATVLSTRGQAAPRLWPRILLGAAAGVAIGTSIFVFATAPAEAPAHSAAVPPPTETADPEADEADARSRTVLLHSSAPGAEARVKGERLKLPTNVELAEGEQLHVEISAPGHDPQIVEVSGDEPRIEVPLVPAAPSPRKGTKKRQKPVDGVVDPWPTD